VVPAPYTFTLTDSHSSAVQVAGTNGANLQAGSASSSAGSFSITVHADNGAGSTFNKTFLITVTAAVVSHVLQEDGTSKVLQEDGSSTVLT
jgi:hypothetical protein